MGEYFGCEVVLPGGHVCDAQLPAGPKHPPAFGEGRRLARAQVEAALDVLGSADHLPPVLSGHNAYRMWGPGHASDRTVLVVDALGRLRPYFNSCRLLTTYHAPYQVQNDWTPLQIGVCTGPSASWQTPWPRLKHYQ